MTGLSSINAITKMVLRGGVADLSSIPPELLLEMHRVGNRNGHYQAFIEPETKLSNHPTKHEHDVSCTFYFRRRRYWHVARVARDKGLATFA